MDLGEEDHSGKVLFSSHGHVLLNHLLSWMHLGHSPDENIQAQPGVELEMTMPTRNSHLPLPTEVFPSSLGKVMWCVSQHRIN